MSIFNKIHVYNILEVSIIMKPLKDKISITIDNDLLARIRELAERDDRSLSQYINLVLKKHLEEIANPKQ